MKKYTPSIKTNNNLAIFAFSLLISNIKLPLLILMVPFILDSEDSKAFFSLLLVKLAITISSLTYIEKDIKSLLLTF